MLRSARWSWWSFIIFTLVCLGSPPGARAFDLEMSLGGGYDDNPRLEKNSEGALFSLSEINLWQNLPLDRYPSTAITLSGFANYQQFDGLDDNWQLGAGLESVTKLPGLPCIFELFSAVVAYRNPLVDDNDFDSLNLGGRLIWLAGPRLSLEIESALKWEDYRQTLTAGKRKNGAGKPQIENFNNSHQEELEITHDSDKTGQPKYHNSGDRNDRLVTAAVKAFYAFTPFLDGGSKLYWRQRHSSIGAEKRSAYGLGLNLNWHPAANLEFIWMLSGERVPYKYDYQNEDHTEKIYSSEIAASWRRGRWSISGAWSWSRRDSLVNEDDYQKNQWQSRLTYSY